MVLSVEKADQQNSTDLTDRRCRILSLHSSSVDDDKAWRKGLLTYGACKGSMIASPVASTQARNARQGPSLWLRIGASGRTGDAQRQLIGDGGEYKADITAVASSLEQKNGCTD